MLSICTRPVVCWAMPGHGDPAQRGPTKVTPDWAFCQDSFTGGNPWRYQWSATSLQHRSKATPGAWACVHMVPVLGKKLFLLLLPLQEILRKGFHIYPKHFVRYEQLIISNGSDITAKRIMGCCLPLPLALTPWRIQIQSRNASACMASLFTLGLQSTFFKPSTALVSGTCTGNITCFPSIFFLGVVMEIPDSLVAQKRREFSSFSYQK